MNNVLAIVVTFNGERWINRCLSSLFGFDVLVVDNNSTDNTVAFIKKDFPDVKIIALSQNIGFGQANNIGFQYAIERDYEFVFLLNQDAWIVKGQIENLIRLYNTTEKMGVLSPIHIGPEGLDFLFSVYLCPKYCPNFYSDLFIGNLKDFYEIAFVNAAAWLISTDLLKKVGGFSPLFYHYGEDNDFIERVKYAGYFVAVTPKMVIFHDRKSSKGIKSSYIQREKRKFILEIKNPNKSFFFAWREMTAYLISKMISEIIRLNIKDAIIYLFVFLWGVIYVWKILVFRMRDKKGIFYNKKVKFK